MFFSFKNFFKFVLVAVVFLLFFLLVNFLYDLDNNDFLKNIDTVPVIEPDNEPFRIKIENKQDNPDPFTDSCTLNNEC